MQKISRVCSKRPHATQGAKMGLFRYPLVVLGALAVGLVPAAGQTSFPMVTHTTPVAVQRGKTTEVVVAGQQNFLGVYKALFEGTGITAEVVPQPAPKAVSPQKPLVRSVKLKLTVAPDAALGPREF